MTKPSQQLRSQADQCRREALRLLQDMQERLRDVFEDAERMAADDPEHVRATGRVLASANQIHDWSCAVDRLLTRDITLRDAALLMND